MSCYRKFMRRLQCLIEVTLDRSFSYTRSAHVFVQQSRRPPYIFQGEGPHHKLPHQLQPDQELCDFATHCHSHQTVLGTDNPLDRVRAGFSMALSYCTYPAVQAINEPLKTKITEYIVKHGIQLGGNSMALVPGQIGYSDQKRQEMDSSVILSQQQGYRLLNKKRIMKEENEDN